MRICKGTKPYLQRRLKHRISTLNIKHIIIQYNTQIKANPPQKARVRFEKQ